MQNMLTNNPYYIGDAIIVMFGFSVLICHPPNLLDKFGEQIWRERPEKALKLDFSGGRPSAYGLSRASSTKFIREDRLGDTLC